MARAPIFEYDDRYIKSSKFTREELYKLQEIVLEQMEKNPTTYINELKGYDQEEIHSILLMIKSKETQKK